MVLMEVSRRLTRWVRSEFPPGSSEKLLDELRDLPAGLLGGQDPERIQASLVIRTGGSWYVFQECVQVAHSDWRDALVGAGLGDKDWRYRLDEILGPHR